MICPKRKLERYCRSFVVESNRLLKETVKRKYCRVICPCTPFFFSYQIATSLTNEDAIEKFTERHWGIILHESNEGAAMKVKMFSHYFVMEGCQNLRCVPCSQTEAVLEGTGVIWHYKHNGLSALLWKVGRCVLRPYTQTKAFLEGTGVYLTLKT